MIVNRALSALALTIAGFGSGPAVAQDGVASIAATAAPDPARLAAATVAVAALVPEGVYLRMMRDQFPAMMDAVMAGMMGMSASELTGIPASGDEASLSMSDMAREHDPAFEERMKITTRVMGEELGTVMGGLEPRIRAGLARAFARKFTVAQLADMNAFFATPSGKLFANEYLMMFVDPDMMREMTSAMPEIVRAMPAMMTKVEAATAHLPPPPKPDADEESDDGTIESLESTDE